MFKYVVVGNEKKTGLKDINCWVKHKWGENITETKLNITIGPVNKSMQPTKVTWQQTGEVMTEQESTESKCVYSDVSVTPPILTVCTWEARHYEVVQISQSFKLKSNKKMFGFFSLKGSLEVFLVVVWGKGGIRIMEKRAASGLVRIMGKTVRRVGILKRKGTVDSKSLKRRPGNTVTMACYGKGFRSQAIWDSAE